MYRFDALDPSESDRPRRMTVDMSDFLENLVARFERDWNTLAPKVSSPFATSADNAKGDDEPQRCQDCCASYMAIISFGPRVCRADCSNSVQRLCTQVSMWTTTDDDNLVRMRGHVGVLAPRHINDLDDEKHQRTVHNLVILFQLCGKCRCNTCTGSSSAEAAFSTQREDEALLVQELVACFLAKGWGSVAKSTKSKPFWPFQAFGKNSTSEYRIRQRVD